MALPAATTTSSVCACQQSSSSEHGRFTFLACALPACCTCAFCIWQHILHIVVCAYGSTCFCMAKPGGGSGCRVPRLGPERPFLMAAWTTNSSLQGPFRLYCFAIMTCCRCCTAHKLELLASEPCMLHYSHHIATIIIASIENSHARLAYGTPCDKECHVCTAARARARAGLTHRYAHAIQAQVSQP